VHTTGTVTLSQVPAQAKPLLAMLTTFGLLLRKLKVVVIGALLPSRALAANWVVVPSSTETVGVGASFITAGTPNPGVGRTLLPQPAKKAIEAVITMAANVNPNLPMHPPRAAPAAGEIVDLNVALVGNLSV
jgi:hypothetical protein